MIIIRNECCNCSSASYPCESGCYLLNVKHYFCDDCGNEIGMGELFAFDGDELCIECIKDRLEKVE